MRRLSFLGTLLTTAMLTGCPPPEPPKPPKKVKKVVAARPEAPRLAALEPTAETSLVAARKASTMLVRMRLKTSELRGTPAPPPNVALVVDTSGSMAGEPIAHARKAARALVAALPTHARVSIVTFGSKAKVLVPSTKLTASSRTRIERAIEGMEARGTTAMLPGLSNGLAQVRGHLSQTGVNRVLLLSDGVPNASKGLHNLARSASSQGITITSLGLGLDYDETLLTGLAQLSGGAFHYVRDHKKMVAMFRDEVLDLHRVVGRRGRLALQPGPGVTLHEVVGMPSTRTGRGLFVDLGDVHEGATRDVMVRVTVPGRRPDATVEVLDARLTYQDALHGAGSVQVDTFLGLRASADEEAVEASRNREVAVSAARAAVGALTLRAIKVARSGDVKHGEALIDQAEAMARSRGKALGDATLIAKADRMAALRASLPALVAQRPIHPVRGPGHPPRELKMPAPRPVPPAAARIIREQHAAAVEDVAGR